MSSPHSRPGPRRGKGKGKWSVEWSGVPPRRRAPFLSVQHVARGPRQGIGKVWRRGRMGWAPRDTGAAAGRCAPHLGLLPRPCPAVVGPRPGAPRARTNGSPTPPPLLRAAGRCGARVPLEKACRCRVVRPAHAAARGEGAVLVAALCALTKPAGRRRPNHNQAVRTCEVFRSRNVHRGEVDCICTACLHVRVVGYPAGYYRLPSDSIDCGAATTTQHSRRPATTRRCCACPAGRLAAGQHDISVDP